MSCFLETATLLYVVVKMDSKMQTVMMSS